MKLNYKRLVCKSGFNVSVQASERNYCTPRNNTGPYTEVELGFPSSPEPLIARFAEDPGAPTETVYGWVPTTVLFQLIEKHGGIESGELPPTNMSPERY
jgi:hypothetical protein